VKYNLNRIYWILFRKLCHWILEKNLSDFFIFRILFLLFRELFIEFCYRVFKFYFANYVIEFWKKIYPIFSYFKFYFFYFANYWFKFGSDQNFDQKLQYKNHVLIKKRWNCLLRQRFYFFFLFINRNKIKIMW